MVRGFTFEARFGPEGLPNGVASDLVPFIKVRVVLVNAAGTRVVDRVVDFPSNVQEVPLSFDVPLAAGSGSTGESMTLSLAFVNAAGDTVFRGGPQQVQVVPTLPGSEPPPAPQILITFTGTGAAATSVVISTLADTVLAGNAFSYSAVARDALGSAIAGTPIAWRSASPTRATITAPGSGAGTTLPSRGPALIIAQLLSVSGAADTVLLEVLPRAGALVGVSGSGQSALVGSLLSQPVVVRVNATDGLPMAGVTVSFAAANGGSVGSASAVTNASGLAQTTWTLGGGVGVQSLTATSTGLSGSPLTINATATVPVVSLIHHYPFNSDLNDIVGTANGTFGGTNNAIAAQVLAFGGTNGFVQFASQIVPNTGSYSVSLFVRNRSTSTLTEYISQGTSNSPGFYIGHDAAGNLRVSDVFPSTGGAAPAADGLFRHLVLVVDSIANRSYLYTNGALQLTLVQRIATPATGNNTRLGRQFDPFGEFMDGDIDELRVYSGAIDAAAVTALFVGGVSAPGRLLFGVQPTTVTAGVAIAPAITVRAEDALGRLRTSYSGTVTLALAANPGSAALIGTLSVAAVNGVATFANVSVSNPAVGYTLAATATGITGATSAAFSITAPLGAIAWSNAAGGNWSTPSNWSLGRVPNATDTVTIALAGTYTVTMDTPFTGAFVTVGGATGAQTLAITSQTLTINNELRTLGTGEVRLVSATVAGAGAVANGGTLYVRGSTIGVPVTNTDSVVVQQTNSIAGALTTVAGSTLRLVGDASLGSATLTVANGFTNRGTIVLAGFGYTMSLAVTAGTLVNAPEGTIATSSGSGTHVITALLNNQGTMSLGQGLVLDRPSAAHVNSGTMTLSGGDVTLSQTGTTPSFTNTGTISIGIGRTWNVNGGTLTQAGSLGGTGTLALTAATLALPTNYTATVRLTLIGATVAGPGVLTNGAAMYMRGSAINAPFTIADSVVVQQINSIAGALTTVAGSSLLLVGDASLGGASLAVANGFTNRGTIVLAGFGYTMSLAVTAGTLVNAPEGTIATSSGSGTHVITALLNNQGTMSLGQGLVLDRPSAAHVNSGTMTLGGSDVTVTGTNPSFTNTGIVSIGAGRTWNVSGGTLTQSGFFDGAGTLALSAATLSLPTSYAPTTLRLSLIGSTVAGPGALTNGAAMYMRGSAINAPFAIADSVVVQQTNSIAGALTTVAGSTLRLVGDASLGSATLTVANGFTNRGTIELAGYNYNMTLTVTAGTLVNAPEGFITTASNSGVHTIAAAVENQGTVRMVPGGAGVLGITGSFVQSGTLEVDLGGLTAGSQYDRLTVSGAATLGGTLSAAYFGGFTPNSGATFAVLTAGAVSGTFATVSLPALLQPAPIYGATTVTLNGPSAVQGIRWASATSGNWSTPAAWDLGRAPIATDSVVIDVGGTYTVTMDVNFTGPYVVVGGGGRGCRRWRWGRVPFRCPAD